MSRAILAGLAVACGACGPGFVDHDAAPGLRDVRVPVPDPSPDMVDLVTPELVIEPGRDAMMCVHMQNDRGDLAIDWVNGIQGAFGHHIAMFTTTEPQP